MRDAVRKRLAFLGFFEACHVLSVDMQAFPGIIAAYVQDMRSMIYALIG